MNEDLGPSESFNEDLGCDPNLIEYTADALANELRARSTGCFIVLMGESNAASLKAAGSMYSGFRGDEAQCKEFIVIIRRAYAQTMEELVKRLP